MTYVATTWVDGVTKLGPTNLNHIETGLATADANATTAQTTANAAVVRVAPATTLPSSPTDGQQAILADSTSAPTYEWLLQWSATAAKWLFIGGSPLEVESAGGVGVASASYVSSSLPSLTIPRAGSYILEYGARLTANNTAVASASFAWIAPKIGAAATSDNDAATFHIGNPGAVTNDATVFRKLKKTFAASDVCQLQVKSDAATTMAWWNVTLAVTPVTVT